MFDMVEKIRENTDVPMVFMTYANVVFSYGNRAFLQACTGSQEWTDLILPDVPYEEKEEFASDSGR